MANITGTDAADIIIPGFNSADTGLPTLTRDVIDGLGGADYLNGGLGDDELSGGEGNDTLLGDAGPDTLSGDGGTDLLLGGIDSDTLNGGEGGDTLLGEGDNDVLDGGAGRDYLVGGDGLDRLWGGVDHDTFIYNLVTESNFANKDIIAGFQGGGNAKGDQIDLSNIDADSTTPDDDPFNWDPAGGGVLGSLWMVGNELRGYTDGVPGADLVIELTAVVGADLRVGAFEGTDILV